VQQQQQQQQNRYLLPTTALNWVGWVRQWLSCLADAFVRPAVLVLATPAAGGLRWKPTADQQAANGPSSSSSSSVPRQPGEQDPQHEDPTVLQQQVERDVQRLARDVFTAGQVLAGGRCASYGMYLTPPCSPGAATASAGLLCECRLVLHGVGSSATDWLFPLRRPSLRRQVEPSCLRPGGVAASVWRLLHCG
jgi:hypothetical protein